MDSFEMFGTVDLEIPEGVTKISTCSYENGLDLRTVTIPASVTVIEPYAFAGCDFIQRFTVSPDNNVYYNDEHGAILTKDGTQLVRFPPAARPYASVDGIEMEQSYDIPNGVTHLAPGACAGSQYIVEFRTPQSLVVIEDGAFECCPLLEEVYIHENVRHIGQRAFYDCPMLHPFHVHLANPCFTDLGCGALMTKDETRLIRVPEAYSGALKLPSSMTTVDPDAFSRCTNVTIHAHPCTYAEVYALTHHIPYIEDHSI